jgi:hypothetical protein
MASAALFWWTAVVSSLAVAWSAAGQPTSSCSGTPHTVHGLQTVGGNATCVLSKLYEPDDFCLVASNGTVLDGVPFPVTPHGSAGWSLIIEDNADFNMEYALTCVLSDGGSAQSPKVVFVVGADGPATPHITVASLYGGRGFWNSTAVGENYTIGFPSRGNGAATLEGAGRPAGVARV